MAADIVNLRQFRKQKARSEKEKQADQNRLSFGRTKAEKISHRPLTRKPKRRSIRGGSKKTMTGPTGTDEPANRNSSRKNQKRITKQGLTGET